ncbi:hypothetical protein C1G87_1375 [Dehalococcoides mccartyi]|uniref:Uncharacterized protein n=1 Tax=Dehalococcoides mccartyi TaxID=61435 RepID=A0A328EJZ2_9CHLR|nr:hypothetical protein C1G87_1375 [Dehalococcoides mccartyi]
MGRIWDIRLVLFFWMLKRNQENHEGGSMFNGIRERPDDIRERLRK